MSSGFTARKWLGVFVVCLAAFFAQSSWAAPFAYIVHNEPGNVAYKFDTATQQLVSQSSPLPGQLNAVAVSPDGSRYYASDIWGNSVYVMDATSNSLITTIPVGHSPYAVAITPDGSRLYVPSFIDATVSVIDTASLTVIKTISISILDPLGAIVSPDGKFVYITSLVSNITVISTASNSVTGQIVVPGFDTFGLVFSADGSTAYVTNDGCHCIYIIDTHQNQVIGNIPLAAGTSPLNLVMSPDGKYLYTANNLVGKVSVISLATKTVIADVVVGTRPYGIDITPDGRYVWVLNSESNFISVIDTATAGYPVHNLGPYTIALGTFGKFIGPGASGSPPVLTSQSITFGSAPSITSGSTGSVSASASSGLPVTFSSLTTGVCTIVGTTVTGVSAGTCTIQATQAGNSTYSSATATQSFSVTPSGSLLTQTIGVGMSLSGGSSIAVGGTGWISGTASSGLPVTLSSVTPSVCSLSGNTITGISVGTCDIRASQAGNGSYAAAQVDTTFAVTVALTSATLVSSANPAALGQTITLTFTLAGSSPFSSPVSGTVQFRDGNSILATVAISSVGSAIFTTSSLATGPHSLSGQYSGDSTHASSSSNTLNQVIGSVTTTTMASSVNPAKSGQTVTFTASVSGASPTGTVTFSEGNTVLGSAPLSGGVAMLVLSTLANGTHQITANYLGDNNNAASASSAFIQRVLFTPTVALTSSKNPSAIGESVTFTATVTGSAPSGTVTFADNGSTIGTASLAGVVATFATSTLAGGDHQIVATYNGDGSNALGSNALLVQTVGSIAPQSGYWWNDAESGRGFVIEIQGTSMFMAGFLYDASGRATWVASNGPMTSATEYSGDLVTYSGGQSLTGAYRGANLGPKIGTLSITFTGSSTGTLTWPGGTIPIKRFDIVAGGAATTQPASNPQTGWWWNPSEGGRGFALEVQGGQMYFAGYMYDASGNPIWYLSNGLMTNSTTYTGIWQLYGNGQTLTGPYRAPSIVTANAGNLTLQFSTSSNATLTLPNGTQIPLVRFLFGIPPIVSVPRDYPDLASALAGAPDGYTVVLEDGVYTGSGFGNLNFGGKKRILTSRNGAASTVIDCQAQRRFMNFDHGEGLNSVISNLTLRNCGIDFQGAIYVLGAAPTITGNIFENTNTQSVASGASLFGFGGSPDIEKNTFRNTQCDDQGLSGVLAFVNSSLPRIANNIFVGNQCRAINMTVPVGAAPVVVNNTMVNNRAGIYIDRRVNSTAHWYSNNLIVGNQRGLEVAFPYSTADDLSGFWQNNLVFGNTTDYLGTTDLTGRVGNIKVDPLLVQNPGDLHLQAGSPAIHVGNPLHAPSDDFDGRTRSGLPDIGAYQRP